MQYSLVSEYISNYCHNHVTYRYYKYEYILLCNQLPIILIHDLSDSILYLFN